MLLSQFEILSQQRAVRSLEEQAESSYSHKDAAQRAGQEFNLVLPDSKMYVHPVDLKLKKARNDMES